MRIDAFLDRLQTVRECGDGWVAECPAHPDEHSSLSVAEGEGGRILLKCHAGCTTQDVVAAMRLSMSDLFPNNALVVPGLTVAALAQAKRLDATWLMQTFGLRDTKATRTRPGGVEIPYRDENGQRLALRYRLALAGKKRFRKMVPHTIYGISH